MIELRDIDPYVLIIETADQKERLRELKRKLFRLAVLLFWIFTGIVGGAWFKWNEHFLETLPLRSYLHLLFFYVLVGFSILFANFFANRWLKKIS